MSTFTRYRVDVDSPRLARVLGKVPGIATEGDRETDEEKASVVKTYGLLGLGISMMMLGIATVGIWVYLRRKGDGDESETPPPAAGLDTGEPAATGLSASETDERPHGRTEGDRSDVEWTTRDTTPESESATDDEPAVEDITAPATDEAESRPTEPVDAAPLLGAAFLAVTGAVVKWLQAGDEA
ncbi:hypothetical protein BRC96_07680 [Halobacteriales archaeon QS_6_64_34]|nr:MAG: hypothetical protein BRC96_07680 [Halobacteriales archaeon QS_6_64_34]